jgi:4-methyl-5(b-hydroxyethyl)-thiazole monophosphate biosynthesis
MGGKICVIFGDGVEEVELVTPVDIFARSGLDTRLFSTNNSPVASGAHGLRFMADGTIDQLDCGAFDCLLIPGGPGSFTLKDDNRVLDGVEAFERSGKLVCAICAAPLILHNAGILGGKKFCCHPCAYDVLKDADRGARVVVDANLITAKGPGVAAEFALAIVTRLCGQEVASRTAKDMFFQIS